MSINLQTFHITVQRKYMYEELSVKVNYRRAIHVYANVNVDVYIVKMTVIVFIRFRVKS